MKTGASISGGMHLGFLVLVAFGMDWFSRADDAPFTVTEIELISGADFEAALSTAPVVPSEGPAELAQPSEGTSAPSDVPVPEDQTERPEQPTLAAVDPPEPRPEQPVVQFTPPPVNIPTEAPVQSIAEIPSPDELDRQSTEPESPASTEPVQPLASIEPPVPGDKPTPPPEPEPEPEQAEPEPDQRPQEPSPEATAEKQPDPEPTQEPEPEAVAETQPEAPLGAAPQEARLPVAKPAELAAAARAASQAEQAQAQPESVANNEPTPSRQAGGSSAAQAPKLSRGERDAMRIGIKRYYVYNGDRSDRSLQVIIRISLNEDGTLNGKPEKRSASGGNPASQNALFQAGRRALIRAAAAGEFKRLPREKYQRWKALNFRFSTDKVGVSS